MTIQQIKDKLIVKEKLFELWNNYPLYKFICGAQYIRQKELKIAKDLTDCDEFIEVCRVVYHQSK